MHTVLYAVKEFTCFKLFNVQSAQVFGSVPALFYPLLFSNLKQFDVASLASFHHLLYFLKIIVQILYNSQAEILITNSPAEQRDQESVRIHGRLGAQCLKQNGAFTELYSVCLIYSILQNEYKMNIESTNICICNCICKLYMHIYKLINTIYFNCF